MDTGHGMSKGYQLPPSEVQHIDKTALVQITHQYFCNDGETRWDGRGGGYSDSYSPSLYCFSLGFREGNRWGLEVD